jgi:hypothetical protein
MLRGLATLVCTVIVLCFAPGASSAGSRPLIGARGSLTRFDALTHQHSRVGLAIIGWNQGLTWGSKFDQLFPTLGEIPLVAITTFNRSRREAITPLAIANGKGDAYFVALNAAIGRWQGSIYVRPFHEMNGYWAPYSAFTRDGRPKPGHSTAMFRRAFERAYILLHGGTDVEVNTKLKQIGEPVLSERLAADLVSNPAPKLKVIWNPQGYSVPQISANTPQAYYPGDRFVDVVGNDLVREVGDVAKWAANDTLYRAHPSKPYAFGEWGLEGVDDPAFVRQMARYVRTHGRVELLVYTQGPRGSQFDLGIKPKSLAAYRASIVPLGR